MYLYRGLFPKSSQCRQFTRSDYTVNARRLNSGIVLPINTVNLEIILPTTGGARGPICKETIAPSIMFKDHCQGQQVILRSYGRENMKPANNAFFLYVVKRRSNDSLSVKQ